MALIVSPAPRARFSGWWSRAISAALYQDDAPIGSATVIDARAEAYDITLTDFPTGYYAAVLDAPQYGGSGTDHYRIRVGIQVVPFPYPPALSDGTYRRYYGRVLDWYLVAFLITPGSSTRFREITDYYNSANGVSSTYRQFPLPSYGVDPMTYGGSYMCRAGYESLIFAPPDQGGNVYKFVVDWIEASPYIPPPWEQWYTAIAHVEPATLLTPSGDYIQIDSSPDMQFPMRLPIDPYISDGELTTAVYFELEFTYTDTPTRWGYVPNDWYKTALLLVPVVKVQYAFPNPIPSGLPSQDTFFAVGGGFTGNPAWSDAGILVVAHGAPPPPPPSTTDLGYGTVHNRDAQTLIVSTREQYVYLRNLYDVSQAQPQRIDLGSGYVAVRARHLPRHQSTLVLRRTSNPITGSTYGFAVRHYDDSNIVEVVTVTATHALIEMADDRREVILVYRLADNTVYMRRSRDGGWTWDNAVQCTRDGSAMQATALMDLDYSVRRGVYFMVIGTTSGTTVVMSEDGASWTSTGL